jgi:hypothetical protein
MNAQTHAVRNWIITAVSTFAPGIVTETVLNGDMMTVQVGAGAIEVNFAGGAMTQIYADGSRGMRASKNDQAGMKEIVRRAAVYAGLGE